MEAPGTAPGSAMLISNSVYRHSRFPDPSNIGKPGDFGKRYERTNGYGRDPPHGDGWVCPAAAQIFDVANPHARDPGTMRWDGAIGKVASKAPTTNVVSAKFSAVLSSNDRQETNGDRDVPAKTNWGNYAPITH